MLQLQLLTMRCESQVKSLRNPTADRICFIFVVFDQPQRGRTLQGLGHFGEVSRLQGTLEKCQNGSLDMKPLLNMSQKRSDQNPFCWLLYIGDAILPSYFGIIISHSKDPFILTMFI